MRKEKFYYNEQTLQFEKLVVPLRVKVLRTAGYSLLVLALAIGISLLLDKIIPSAENNALKMELHQMETQYDALLGEVDLMSKVLDNIQDRDANVHRVMFGMDPIDNDVWNGGVGGSEKYSYLSQFKNTGALLIETQTKADKLKLQLHTQSTSLDNIEIEMKKKEEMLASMPAIKPVRSDKMKRRITAMSGFGMRMHPIHKIRKMHAGLDFSAPRGTAIQATGDGKVEKVIRKKSGYGTHVVINHGYGYKTLYAHMASVSVKKGEKVKRGQQIGTVGNTGTSTAPHLHYEVHHNDKKVNPIHYCMDGLSPEEYQKLAERASETNQSFD